MIPRFTDVVMEYAASVDGNRVELPIKGIITMEEINEAFFAGRTQTWDIACFLIEKCLKHPILDGVRLEVEDDHELGLRTVYLTDQGRESKKK